MNHTSTEILFEKFEIVDCLKKDGQTGVYLANHIFLSKQIILKTLNTDGLSDKTILERFKREAKILARLDHPNIIKVLDFGTYNNFFYISFEYFPGRNLREVINNNNLSTDNKIQLIIQLLRALNIAHQNDIVHRDIKPENILINSTQELKIADFGLALVMNENNLTQSSTVVGTPSYMSPEQIRGEKTHQTDLFSCGLVCFELFTGRNPVLGKDVGTTINNILNFNFESIAKEIENAPSPVKLAIESMLHNNSSKRAKSVSEVLKYFGEEEDQNIALRGITKFKKSYMYTFIILIAAVLSGTVYIKYFFNIKHPQVSPNAFSNNYEQTGRDNITIDIPRVNKTEVKRDAVIGKKPGTVIPIKRVKSDPDKNVDSTLKTVGKVSIDCYPWAQVFIDNKKIDITPLHDFSLSPGRHKIELVQPEFPIYKKYINISSGKTASININFEEMVGYLNCEVYPWAEVYVDNKLIGTTPFTRPVAVTPGTHQLTIKNANYAPVSKVITIQAKQQSSFSYNFQGLKR
jgi:serine/threonine-protein kinase